MLQVRNEARLLEGSTNSCRFFRRAGPAALLMCAMGSIVHAQAPPQAQLDNGPLHVTVALPNAADGFYRGRRFDWSGVITGLTFAGHSYYGPWFAKVDPSVNDYIFSPQGIVAGLASSDSGPVEEFSPLGYDSAKPGGTFVKIGVGTLRKENDRRYSSMHNYPMVDPVAWQVKTTRTSIEFTQKIVDEGSGYGYLYTKTLRLIPGQPRMVIEHSLKNLGRLPIETDVYDHNFTAIDHQPIGPDYSVTLPFPVKLTSPLKPELAALEGNRFVYRKVYADHDVIDEEIPLDPPQPDNDIRVENSQVKAGVKITGDHPMSKFAIWSIRSVMGVEPFIHLTAAPGETIHWSYSYLYYTLP